MGRSDASFVSGGEEISLGHTYLEVPSRYTQDKHLSDKQTPQDEQGAPGQKEISELSVKRWSLMLWKRGEGRGLNFGECLV